MIDMKSKYIIPDDLHYTREHEWVRIEENEDSKIGVTDYAQKSLHEVVYVDLPKPDAQIKQKDYLGTVESVKSVSEIYAPLSGQVVDVNDNLTKSPELINQSPYEKGWIVILKPASLEADLQRLLSPKQYSEFLRQLP